MKKIFATLGLLGIITSVDAMIENTTVESTPLRMKRETYLVLSRRYAKEHAEILVDQAGSFEYDLVSMKRDIILQLINLTRSPELCRRLLKITKLGYSRFHFLLEDVRYVFVTRLLRQAVLLNVGNLVDRQQLTDQKVLLAGVNWEHFLELLNTRKGPVLTAARQIVGLSDDMTFPPFELRELFAKGSPEENIKLFNSLARFMSPEFLLQLLSEGRHDKKDPICYAAISLLLRKGYGLNPTLSCYLIEDIQLLGLPYKPARESESLLTQIIKSAVSEFPAQDPVDVILSPLLLGPNTGSCAFSLVDAERILRNVRTRMITELSPEQAQLENAGK